MPSQRERYLRAEKACEASLTSCILMGCCVHADSGACKRIRCPLSARSAASAVPRPSPDVEARVGAGEVQKDREGVRGPLGLSVHLAAHLITSPDRPSETREGNEGCKRALRIGGEGRGCGSLMAMPHRFI